MTQPLLVIVPDAISAIIAKGEYQPRYYNPGNLFDEVHILMCNSDRPDAREVQSTVGTARLFLHNLPEDKQHFVQFRRIFRPWLLRRWAKPALEIVRRYQLRLFNQWARPAVELAGEIKPGLVRSYGHQLNTYVASQIKVHKKVPYIVSLHGNPDVDYYRGRLAKTWEQKLLGQISLAIEMVGLANADHVIAVYSPITPYLFRHGVKNYSVVYNVVGFGAAPKSSYAIDKRNVRCLWVGRLQSEQKDPSSVIEAVTDMDNVSLVLIGDGDLYEVMAEKVAKAGVGDRIRFIRGISNREVLKCMHESDIFLYSSVNYEVSKGCIEAALTGLPVVVNDRGGDPANELVGGHFMLVDGSKESYRRALERLIEDSAFREQLGRRAYEYAREHWAPAKTEAKYVEIYKRVMAEANDAAGR